MGWIYFLIGLMIGGTGGVLVLLFMQAISDHKED